MWLVSWHVSLKHNLFSTFQQKPTLCPVMPTCLRYSTLLSYLQTDYTFQEYEQWMSLLYLTLIPFCYYLLTDSIKSPSNTSISWISNANFSLHWFALILIVSKFSFVSTIAKVNTDTGVALTQWISWIPSTSNFKDLIKSLWLDIYFSHSVCDLKLKIFVTVILSFAP